MELSHLDEKGHARMVDVTEKDKTVREALACGRVRMKAETLDMILSGRAPKGDVLATARIAGIMAAKHTQDLIPMCHTIPLDGVKVDLEAEEDGKGIRITAAVRCTWKTGVEMEALTAVSVAALTLYDMCKAVDREMVLGDIKLLRKTGGKSGDFQRGEI